MHAAIMSDNSRKTPMPAMPKRPRGQSQDDRDAEGFVARKERDAAMLKKEFMADEITGKYEGSELEEFRAMRPSDERIGRLEKKHDELKADVEKKHEELKGDVKDVRNDVKKLSGDVSTLSSTVSGAVGKIDGQSGVLTEMLTLVKKTAERDHVTFTAKVEVDKERELAEVEVDKELALSKLEVEKKQKLEKVEIEKSQELDKISARKARRKLLFKGLGLLGSGGLLVEICHKLGWL